MAYELKKEISYAISKRKVLEELKKRLDNRKIAYVGVVLVVLLLITIPYSQSSREIEELKIQLRRAHETNRELLRQKEMMSQQIQDLKTKEEQNQRQLNETIQMKEKENESIQSELHNKMQELANLKEKNKDLKKNLEDLKVENHKHENFIIFLKGKLGNMNVHMQYCQEALQKKCCNFLGIGC
eukprot:TRINITY_DN1844_c0_g2_i2.p1 TRINITY_DN1844_c0_g2~~TRINITY_DN1844_c0_g2_i2.p1  ORF type:complete len:184 (+),score=31.89 TRINITY_DN1844_c0_g2_i2:135-686(+)